VRGREGRESRNTQGWPKKPAYALVAVGKEKGGIRTCRESGQNIKRPQMNRTVRELDQGEQKGEVKVRKEPFVKKTGRACGHQGRP